MNLTSLRAEVRLHTPADNNVLDFCILRAAIDFFTQSEAWQVTDEVSVLAGNDTFDVPTVANGQFIKLLAIELADKVIEGDDLYKFCTAGESGAVRLVKKAEGDITLKVKSVYAPTDDATTINDAIGRQYHNGLVHGALARTFLIPKMPWTDDSKSEFYRIKWENAAEKARTAAYDGKQRGPKRTRLALLNGR